MTTADTAIDAGQGQVSTAFRWVSLLMISFVVLGTYYAYDSISPIGDLIKKDLGITSAQFGYLYSAYSLPNFVMLLVGGMLIDRIGTRIGGMLFAGLCLLGTVVTALGSHSLAMMLVGRFLFGLGAECIIVVQSKIIAKWFIGRELALAFGVNLSICRLGTWFSYMSINGLTNRFGSWNSALWFVAILMAVSFSVFMAYAVMDRRMSLRVKIEEEKSERIDFREIFRLPKSFWLISLLCVTFYSAVFPFQQFAPQIFKARFGMESEYGSPVTSLIILLTIFGTPLFGWLCDKFGKRATMMIVGSLLIIPIHLAIGFLGGGAAARPTQPLFDFLDIRWYRVFPLNTIDIVPILPIMVLGLAFSLVPAAMWPSVARMVEQKRLGTAYGVIAWIQMVGLFGVPPLLGWAENPPCVKGILGPFQLSMLILATLGLLGATFAVLLKIADRKAKVSIEAPEKRSPQ